LKAHEFFCFQDWRDKRAYSLMAKQYDGLVIKSSIQIVSAWLSESGLSIGQVKVDDKSNEITAIPELLDRKYNTR
jgi:hypothetical protein